MPVGLAVRRGRRLGERPDLDRPDRRRERMDEDQDRDGAGTSDAVSCPSVSLCVAGDENGNILTSTDPTGGASAWTKSQIDRDTVLSQHRLMPVGLAVRRGRRLGQHLDLDRSDRRREHMEQDPCRSAGATSRRLVPVGLAVHSRRPERQHPDVDRSDRRREHLEQRID